MVKMVCGSISAANRTMTYVEFSSIRYINTSVASPFQFTSGTNINTLSLANNQLQDDSLKSCLTQWSASKPTISVVIVEPGNPSLSERCKSKLTDFLNGIPYEVSGSEYTTSSESASSSESEATSPAHSRSTTPIVSKPPLPPRRSSLQGSVSAKSDKSEVESEKAESDKAESEESISHSQQKKKGKIEFCYCRENISIKFKYILLDKIFWWDLKNLAVGLSFGLCCATVYLYPFV